MFRKDLIHVLLDNPMTVAELAELTEQSPKDVDDDLRHLFRSLKRTDYRATVTPAECQKCGFRFHADKLRKPSKCPSCHSTWLSAPLVRIERER